MDFTKLANNFRNFDMADIVVEVAVSHDAELADLNLDQLNKGYLSTGQRTKQYESDDYSNLKKSIGSRSAPYADLKLEGDFHAGWNVKGVGGKWIEFDSDDSKTPDLEEKYSPDIFGLTDENKGEAADIIINDPDLNKKVHERLTQG